MPTFKEMIMESKDIIKGINPKDMDSAMKLLKGFDRYAQYIDDYSTLKRKEEINDDILLKLKGMGATEVILQVLNFDGTNGEWKIKL